MITEQMLKEFALRLEGNPQCPFTLALVIGGKPHRLECSDEYLPQLTKTLNEIISEQREIELVKNMPSERYAEWEDIWRESSVGGESVGSAKEDTKRV
jgi:hypothetical protein